MKVILTILKCLIRYVQILMKSAKACYHTTCNIFHIFICFIDIILILNCYVYESPPEAW